MSNSSSISPPSPSSNGLPAGITTVAIVLFLVGGVVVIVIAIKMITCIQKYKTQQIHASTQPTSDGVAINSLNPTVSADLTIEMASIEKFLDDFLNENPKRFTPQHLTVFTQNYAEKLGSGGFGVVYKGQFPNWMPIAVKVLNGMDKRADEQFMAEVGSIGRTNHINLVRLYGFCSDDKVKALVYEYMENGSLDQYLFGNDRRLEWGKLFEISVGTAKGIRYLHEECEKMVVHSDIKPGNVLLSASFTPKLAVFCLAKLCDRENTHVTMTGGRGTPGYAAPELWMPFPVTHKCDVYSFGMLLLEILGSRKNLELMQPESQEWFPRWVWQKFEQGELKTVISRCGIEEKDREDAERMCKVALWCVQYQPEARPTMNSVVRMLEGEQEIVAPVNPFRYMESFDAASSLSSENTRDSNSTGTAKNESETSCLSDNRRS